jgi:hypothetical protein
VDAFQSLARDDVSTLPYLAVSVSDSSCSFCASRLVSRRSDRFSTPSACSADMPYWLRSCEAAVAPSSAALIVATT